jgi:hypothetical protein
MTAVLPLTTTFTPSTDCYANWWHNVGGWDFVVDPLNLGPCLPHSVTASTYFSPGLICPAGFRTACTGSTVMNGVPVSTATCCPVFSDFALTCTTTDIEPDFDTTFGCTYSMQTSTTVTGIGVDWTGTLSSTTTGILDPGNKLYGPSVLLVWQEKDLSLITPSASTSILSPITGTASGSVTTSATGTMTTSTLSAASSTASGGGLSTRAKAGIGIGVVAICFVAMLAVFFSWRRYRAMQAPIAGALMQEDLEVSEPRPDAAEGYGRPIQDSTGAFAPGAEKTAELPEVNHVRNLPFELPDRESTSPPELPGHLITSRSELPESQPFHRSELPENQPIHYSAPSHNPNTAHPDVHSSYGELSAMAPTPILNTVNPSSAFQPPLQQQESSTSPVSKPWEASVPLSASSRNRDEELRRIEEEERRIDAEIAETERVITLRQAKADLQAQRLKILEGVEQAQEGTLGSRRVA